MNPGRLDSLRNESTSAFLIAYAGSYAFAWIAQRPPSCSSATRSIPASGPQASGQSVHSQTRLKRPRYSGAFVRYQPQSRSNCAPALRSGSSWDSRRVEAHGGARVSPDHHG